MAKEVPPSRPGHVPILALVQRVRVEQVVVAGYGRWGADAVWAWAAGVLWCGFRAKEDGQTTGDASVSGERSKGSR
eukprot:12544230-Prorocentrum_lima.AAC.1